MTTKAAPAARKALSAGTGLNPVGPTAQVWSTGLQSYGFGIGQGIDAAAMTVYLMYRHTEADLELRDRVGGGGNIADGPINSVNLEDLDVVMSGAIIKF